MYGVMDERANKAIQTDGRFTSQRHRCATYYSFVRRGGSMTPEAYAAVGGGACRDYPLDAYPWTP